MYEEMKDKLDKWASLYNVSAFIENDPIQFPRQFATWQDKEVAVFLTSTITWGKRSSILKSAEKMFDLMGASPYDYVTAKGYEHLGKRNVHRTFFEPDLYYLCKGLDFIYSRYSSLEKVFSSGNDLWDGIQFYRDLLALGNGKSKNKHISNPASGSACKRLHMALRWLVRCDGIVDMGIWKTITPAELFIPLDTHVARISRQLGLLNRKSNDKKAVEDLTSKLRLFNPDDPVLYDFALFGLGESGDFENF